MKALSKVFKYCLPAKFPLAGYVAILALGLIWGSATYALAQDTPIVDNSLQHVISLFKVVATVLLLLVGTIESLIAFIYITGIKNIDKVMSLHVDTMHKELDEIKNQITALDKNTLSKEEHELICKK